MVCRRGPCSNVDADLSQLRKRHPEHERWSRTWPDYRLAYRGGEEFIAAAGLVSPYRYDSQNSTGVAQTLMPGLVNTPVRRFLRQFEGEPTAVYNALWQRSEYINYLSPAINYFLAYLHATPPVIRPKEGEEAPDWWGSFERNASGSGKGLLDMARDLLLESMLCRRAGWLIGRPASVVEQESGDESQILSPYKAEEIWDWQLSECGELEWVVLHKETLRREFPGDRYRVETITYLDAEEWTTWEITQDPESKQESLVKIGEGVHGLGRVPFVMQELPDGLWITDKLYAPQIGLFNQWVRLKNAMTLGCVMQPFVQTNEPGATSRIIGEGIMLHLRAGSEADKGEEFGWKSPDVTPLQFIWTHYKEAVAEMYRVIHQMSMAVDAKSVASIARSGTSKFEDRKSTEIILKGFGAIQTDTIIRTMSLVSEIYGDNTTWTLDGFDDFNVSEPMEDLTFLMTGLTAGIESPTFKKRAQQRAARLVLEKEDASTMATIDEEIDEAIDAAGESAIAELPVDEQAAGDLPPDAGEADTSGLSAAGEPPGAGAIDIEDNGQ